jgi:hypothetical protein
MRKPVSDAQNNWFQVEKKSGGQYDAGVGKETFDAEIEILLPSGAIKSATLFNPVELEQRTCADAALAHCGISAYGTGSGANAPANSGGGGGGCVNSSYGQSGGGGGQYVEIIVNSPASSYNHTVAASASATTGGSCTGGSGSSGIIIVDEYY